MMTMKERVMVIVMMMVAMMMEMVMEKMMTMTEKMITCHRHCEARVTVQTSAAAAHHQTAFVYAKHDDE
jgi:hypothetical protein